MLNRQQRDGRCPHINQLDYMHLKTNFQEAFGKLISGHGKLLFQLMPCKFRFSQICYAALCTWFLAYKLKRVGLKHRSDHRLA